MNAVIFDEELEAFIANYCRDKKIVSTTDIKEAFESSSNINLLLSHKAVAEKLDSIGFASRRTSKSRYWERNPQAPKATMVKGKNTRTINKVGLEFDRHQEIATDIKHILNKLHKLSIELSRCYPLTQNPNRHALKAERYLDELRSELEDRMFKEHPAQANTHVYYGETK